MGMMVCTVPNVRSCPLPQVVMSRFTMLVNCIYVCSTFVNLGTKPVVDTEDRQVKHYNAIWSEMLPSLETIDSMQNHEFIQNNSCYVLHISIIREVNWDKVKECCVHKIEILINKLMNY